MEDLISLNLEGILMYQLQQMEDSQYTPQMSLLL